ncbi:MAG: alpha/beta hydrolase [Halioglobus sp.]
MDKKYDIHPDFARFPVMTFKFGAVLLWLFNTVSRILCFFARRSLDLTLENHFIARPDGTRLKVIAMTPQGLVNPAPALVYYHGGGFALTYASLHLQNCARYAREAGCVVFFVEYRLMPRHPFPGGFDDCYSALQWVVRQADALGIDSARIAVGGDSAGGALAAGVAQKARDAQLVALCAQLLVYPVLDNRCATPSATDFVDVPLWNAISNRHMWKMYLARYPAGETPPYAAPGHGHLQNLPLSYVETAEFDPLRDEGLNYASALQAQGVDVTLNATRQTVHGYDGMAKSEIARKSMLQRIDFLKRAFNANRT